MNGRPSCRGVSRALVVTPAILALLAAAGCRTMQPERPPCLAPHFALSAMTYAPIVNPDLYIMPGRSVPTPVVVRVVGASLEPLGPVAVVLEPGRRGGVTDSLGVVRFEGVPAGRYEVRALEIGYRGIADSITHVPPGTDVAVVLVPGYRGLQECIFAEPPRSETTDERVRVSGGVSAAAVRFSGETWPRAGAWAEVRGRSGFAVHGEVWGVRRATLLCPGGSSHPMCDETSDAVGWALGARLYHPRGPGEAWAGVGLGKGRYDGPAGRVVSTNAHFLVGYQFSLGDRLLVGPRLGVDWFLSDTALGGWPHMGVEAGVRF